jgi:hypothetical protein
MAWRHSGAAHEAPDGLRRLAGEQFDVVEAHSTVRVEICDELPGERDRFWEALPDRAARGHVWDVVFSQHAGDDVVGVQSIDQLDLIGPRLRHRPTYPHRETQIMGAAQHHVARGVELAADVVGGQAIAAVKVR